VACRGVTGYFAHAHFKNCGKGAQGFQSRAIAVLNALNGPHAEASKFGQLLLGPGALQT
jgi:hypothetical protein